MNSKDLVVNYLTDNEERMRNVITWFLNEVMQREADELAGAARYERTGSRRTYRMGQGLGLSNHDMAPYSSINPYCGILR